MRSLQALCRAQKANRGARFFLLPCGQQGTPRWAARPDAAAPWAWRRWTGEEAAGLAQGGEVPRPEKQSALCLDPALCSAHGVLRRAFAVGAH